MPCQVEIRGHTGEGTLPAADVGRGQHEVPGSGLQGSHCPASVQFTKGPADGSPDTTYCTGVHENFFHVIYWFLNDRILCYGFH